ncbi:hypothetical protein MPLSOD_110188 [Mesorhizobium sp. SOD10]|nr:hypothetical protein MPLSOD_110188 [Mesorhizobium sp. SOD10]
MISKARQVPSRDREFAVASEVKVQLMFITGVFVLILTVPLPENFPCSERRKAASSACAPVEQKRQAAASNAAIDFIKGVPLSRSLEQFQEKMTRFWRAPSKGRRKCGLTGAADASFRPRHDGFLASLLAGPVE